MTTATAEDVSGGHTLSEVVARRIRAEAAWAGLTQAQLGVALGVNRVGVDHRFRGITPWTLDEVERAARLFGVRPADLLSELPRLDSNQQPSGYRTRGHLSPVA